MRYKNLLFLFVLFLFVVSVNAGPQNPYVVHGWVQVDGQGVKDMTVSLTNIATGESREFLSKGDGAFGFYLEKWNSGFSNGDALKLTYCISDTRCNEKENTEHSVSGLPESGGINIGIFNSNIGGGGGSNPYIVSGTIKKDGTFITSGSITLLNVNTGESVPIELDFEGYQYNLNSLDNGYNTGDTIRITYDSEDYEFIVTGDNKVFNVVKTTPSTPDSGDSGDGGGVGPSPGIPAGCSLENKRYWIRGEDCVVTCTDFDNEMMINKGYIQASYNCFIKEDKDKDTDDDGVIDDGDDVIDDGDDVDDGGEEPIEVSVNWIYWLIGIIVIVALGYYFFFRKPLDTSKGGD